MRRITVVFPAYNEEDIIEKTVKNAVAYLNTSIYDWDILIVNNCSTDNTGRIIDGLAKENPKIKAIHHPANLGYATSLNTGLKNAEGDCIFIIDSDGQHTVKDIEKFVAKIDEGCDVVFGWKKKRYDPMLRLIMTRALNYSSRLLLHSRLHDINCGFRAFNRKAAEKIVMSDRSNVVGPEVYVRAVTSGLRIDEVVVNHFPRETGKSVHMISKLPVILFNSYAMLFRLRKELLANEQK